MSYCQPQSCSSIACLITIIMEKEKDECVCKVGQIKVKLSSETLRWEKHTHTEHYTSFRERAEQTWESEWLCAEKKDKRERVRRTKTERWDCQEACHEYCERKRQSRGEDRAQLWTSTDSSAWTNIFPLRSVRITERDDALSQVRCLTVRDVSLLFHHRRFIFTETNITQSSSEACREACERLYTLCVLYCK